MKTPCRFALCGYWFVTQMARYDRIASVHLIVVRYGFNLGFSPPGSAAVKAYRLPVGVISLSAPRSAPGARTKAAQGGGRPEGNADADRRQKGIEGGCREEAGGAAAEIGLGGGFGRFGGAEMEPQRCRIRNQARWYRLLRYQALGR
jgi:hypothetical protein